MYIDDLSISLLFLAGLRLIASLSFLVLYIRRGGIRYLVLAFAWFVYMLGPVPDLVFYSEPASDLFTFAAFSAAAASYLLMIGLSLYIRTIPNKLLAALLIIPIAVIAVLNFFLPHYAAYVSTFMQGLFLLLMLAGTWFNRSMFSSARSDVSYFWLCLTLILGIFHAVGFNLFLRDAPMSFRFMITGLLNLSLLIFFFYLDWEQAYRELDNSLKEKEILLQEVHHRVKNNLTIISSIMQLQSRKPGCFESDDIIRSIENRINSMALVHEKLYESRSFKEIDFGQYLADLVDGIRMSFENEAKPVDISINVLPVRLRLEHLVPIGMLMNEILTNAFKHAFKLIEEPSVRIALYEAESGGFYLSVKDNGKGFVSSDIDRTDSTGFVIIDALVYQLGANLEVLAGEGSEYRLYFPPDGIIEGNMKKTGKFNELI